MDPYTPRHRGPARKKNLTLSAKEYTKVTGTIASVRRNRHTLDVNIEEEPNGHERGYRSSKGPSDSTLKHGLRESSPGGQDPSFIAETSFVKAPLNSRVASNSHNSTQRSRGKGKSKEEALENVSLDIQEAMILEDLLFVLMACALISDSSN
jgi:gamma-tubulin complex component 2